MKKIIDLKNQNRKKETYLNYGEQNESRYQKKNLTFHSGSNVFEVDKKKLAFLLSLVLLVVMFAFFVYGKVSADKENNDSAKAEWSTEELDQIGMSNDTETKEYIKPLSEEEEAIADAWEDDLDKEVEVVVDENGNEVLRGGETNIKIGEVDERHYYEPLNPKDVSPISGIPCDNKDRRPIAVMLSADKAVRPLSGIGEADLVVEMQVISGTITRLMPVYVCNSPSEIGSIRSARHDYITLAKGFDAIFAHWGGSHFALDYLKNTNTVPDLDAMKNPYGAFFRKSGIRMPHNGFASYDGLRSAADKMGYRLENEFEGYPHRPESHKDGRGNKGMLEVGFPGICKTSFEYDPQSNSYLRFWNGIEDIDKLTGKRIAPKNVVVAYADSRQIEGQYNDVDIEGQGEMIAFIEGRVFKGDWKKEKSDCVIGDERVCVNDKRLKFFKENGQELEFVPGQIWIEILDPHQKVTWKSQ